MYKLINGNCLTVLKSIPTKSIDLILIDPPYLISRDSDFNSGGSWNNSPIRMTPPKLDFGEWDKKQLNYLFKEYYRILKPHGTLLCFYDIWKMQELKKCGERANFKQFRLCRWDKTNPVPVNSKTNYLSNATEYFITCVKEGKPTFHSEYDSGIYRYPICSGNERTAHPTQKPLSLIMDLILKHSNEKDWVLDCFMGSGTTGEASLRTRRNFIGVELDKDYFNIAKNRIENVNIIKQHFLVNVGC